jgi:predicted glycosyltransferase
MRVWLDLSNSPHPLLFAPVVRRLEAEGHSVVMTARDNAQTVELARERWPDVEVIGGSSPRGRGAKAGTLLGRIAELRRWARARRPDVALSHNSYAQIVAARSLRLRTVTAMDFEHQPANHLAFRLAGTVLLPEPLRDTQVARQGATEGKTTWYPGLKEELYLGDFEPDPGVLEGLGIPRAPDTRLVVARTPPDRAIYHRFGNSLFGEALQTLGARENAHCVVLTRDPEQREAIEALGLPRCVVPRSSLDSRSLMYEADLVLGAGGTMTREAALMGVPTFSLFAGERPKVDEWLEERGLLHRLTDRGQLDGWHWNSFERHPLERIRSRSEAINEVFVRATLGSQAPSGATRT